MASLTRLPPEVLGLFESLERSPDPVFVTDRRNRIVFWNQSAARILGRSGEETLGLACDRLLQGSDVFGNRYCSEECPVMRMAARGEAVKGFRMTFAAGASRSLTAEMAVLQLTLPAPEHYYLVHVVRPVDGGATPQVAPAAPPPPAAGVHQAADVRAQRLTGREVEVLGMLAAGRTTPEIAERLHIAPLTARNHIQNILEKLEVHSKSEAIAFAFQKRIL